MILPTNINSLFSELFSGLSIKIKRVNKGSSTHVFSIITENGEKYYLRIPKNPAESVIPEVMIHNELHKIGVRLPNVIAYSDSNVTLEESPFILLKSIGDFSCSNKLLSINQLKSILHDAGKDLFLINSVSAEMFGSVFKTKNQTVNSFQGNQYNYKDFICYRIERNLHILKNSQYFTNIQIDIIKKILSSDLFDEHISKVKQGYLAHGDYHLDHIFQDGGLYSGIIDFGDAKITSKGYDLAYFKIRNKDYYKYLYSGYIEAAGVSSNFLDDSMLVFLVGIRILASAIENNKINMLNNSCYLSFTNELNKLNCFL